MKKTLMVLGMTLLLSGVNGLLYAKSSKDEREWKRKKKFMKPYQLKELIEENSSLKLRVTQLNALEEGNKAKTKEIIALKKEINDLKEEIDSGREEVQSTKEDEDFTQDVVFVVQIGTCEEEEKEYDLSDVLGSTKVKLVQEKADGLNKYTLGYFKNYWEADRLKKMIRKMGIQDAWIVPLKGGQRVPLKEVINKVAK